MNDYLITNATIVTQNKERDVIENGAVAITDGIIQAVGSANKIEPKYNNLENIDATDGVVFPGLINAHTHVSDILFRGSFTPDRGLYDWLLNVKRPGSIAMNPQEHADAASLYCVEAINAGVTTFVENDTEIIWDNWDTIESKLNVYDKSGIRNIYGAGFTDTQADEIFQNFAKNVQARNPDVKHVDIDCLYTETSTALSEIEKLINKYHGSAEGRQSIWPAPSILVSSSKEGLQRAYELAEKYDVMTTTHVSEAEIEEESQEPSSIEYLRNIDYLGERSLLGHCVQIDANDVRILAKHEASVAHNYLSNMRLATGFAPIVSMLDSGVTVGFGTDNAELNDTINPLSDLRAAAVGHKGYHRTPGVFSAKEAFDMVTIKGAQAIGREDDLGSIECGKQADIVIADFDYPHLTPCSDPIFSLIYNLQGFEIQTVICAGNVVMKNDNLKVFDRTTDQIMRNATESAERIINRVGIQ